MITVGIAVGILGFLIIRNCFKKRKDVGTSTGTGTAMDRDLRVVPPGPGVPVAFPPPTPGPIGQMAQTYPRVADRLEMLARRVQGEEAGGFGANLVPLPGGFSRQAIAVTGPVVSYFPAPQDKVAKIHPDLAVQLAAIASRVANEDDNSTTTTAHPAVRPTWQQPTMTAKKILPPRTYSPPLPPEPIILPPGRGPSSSYTGSDSDMSSSLESMTQLSRESVRQMGFQHPVNHWVHLNQGPAGAIAGPAPSRPLPRPVTPAINNSRGPPPGPQMAAYDMGRY